MPASARSSPGSGSPSCLRGNWVATQGETRRVLRALVPGGLFTSYGRLYMTFRDGAFQYGSTGLVLKSNLGDATMTARARFFSLRRTPRAPGLLVLRPGESTIEYGPMSGTKDGRTYTVPGPPTRTTPTPGGSTPFQCRGRHLRCGCPGSRRSTGSRCTAASGLAGARPSRARPRSRASARAAGRSRRRPRRPRSGRSGPGARRSRRARRSTTTPVPRPRRGRARAPRTPRRSPAHARARSPRRAPSRS